MSHPQALAQCTAYLMTHFPKAKLTPTASTVSCFSDISAKGWWGVAGIGPHEAAEKFGLKILSDNVEDDKNNVTRFVVVAKEDSPATGRDKTSFIANAYSDRPGLLHDLLAEFSSRGINLNSIESRPSRRRLGEYAFYITVAAHRTDKPLVDAMRALEEKKIASIELYGSYPAWG